MMVYLRNWANIFGLNNIYLILIDQSFKNYIIISINTIHMYSGITSGRVLNGELLYTKILEVNLFAFAYRLFRRDFSPLDAI